MEETKDPKAAMEGGTPERDAEATSSETLSDIESSEKVTGGGSSGGSESSSLEGSSPNPDSGGGEGSADGSETGGPM